MTATMRLERAPSEAGAVSRALRALLDRPSKWTLRAKPCPCGGCRRIRSRRFACGVCGYRGQPYVFPCECKAFGAHVKICPTEAEFTRCGHGTVCCPVCNDGDASVTYFDHYDNPWNLVRDLRAILERGGVLAKEPPKKRADGTFLSP